MLKYVYFSILMSINVCLVQPKGPKDTPDLEHYKCNNAVDYANKNDEQ